MKNMINFFYANFTPELERRIRTELNIDDGISLRKYFAMYAPVEVNMEPASDIEPPDFSPIFRYRNPDNAYINIRVLEIPGSMYHFTAISALLEMHHH